MTTKINNISQIDTYNLQQDKIFYQQNNPTLSQVHWLFAR